MNLKNLKKRQILKYCIGIGLILIEIIISIATKGLHLTGLEWIIGIILIIWADIEYRVCIYKKLKEQEERLDKAEAYVEYISKHLNEQK